MYGITEILYDITLILYDITILYPWCHIHSIHDSTPNLYGITYFILAISQRLYIWQDTCVYDIILSIYDILHGVRMETKPRYLTSHSQYMCNQTHLIDDIIHYVCMKSHPMHVGHQRHYLWHHIFSWWHHTSVCMSWNPLCLWHRIHYIQCHTHCLYDKTSSISDLKHILSAITSTVYVITPTLSKTSHQLCKTSQVAHVCHHVQYTWHHIHPLRQQPLVFMTSHALYWWHHMHYIWHVIYCVWYHIYYMCDITQCLYLWHQKLYVYDISTLYVITHSVMTTQLLCNFTATMSDITPTVYLSSHPVD